MSDALATLYESIHSRLLNANPLWEDRVESEYIPTDNARPVIVYGFVAGGENNDIRKRDPSYLLDIKIITSSDNQNANEDAMAGAGFITDLIDNQGSQDVGSDGNATDRAMTGNAEWLIRTITQGTRIHVVDNWSKNGIAVYHSGHEFMIRMEEI